MVQDGSTTVELLHISDVLVVIVFVLLYFESGVGGRSQDQKTCHFRANSVGFDRC